MQLSEKVNFDDIFDITNRPERSVITTMFIVICTILSAFCGCFSTISAFSWFIILVVTFMVWEDKKGMTSVIRYWEFDNNDRAYKRLLYFLKGSKAYELQEIQGTWTEHVHTNYSVYETENGEVVYATDATIESCEGNSIPAEQKLAERSENAAIPEMTKGHSFEFLSVLVKQGNKICSVPLFAKIASGLKYISQWKEDGTTKSEEELAEEAKTNNSNHAVMMIRQAFATARQMKRKFVWLVDRGYPSVKMFVAWLEELLHEKPGNLMRFFREDYKYTEEDLERAKQEGRLEFLNKEEKKQKTPQFDEAKINSMRFRGIKREAGKIYNNLMVLLEKTVTSIKKMEEKIQVTKESVAAAEKTLKATSVKGKDKAQKNVDSLNGILDKQQIAFEQLNLLKGTIEGLIKTAEEFLTAIKKTKNISEARLKFKEMLPILEQMNSLKEQRVALEESAKKKRKAKDIETRINDACRKSGQAMVTKLFATTNREECTVVTGAKMNTVVCEKVSEEESEIKKPGPKAQYTPDFKLSGLFAKPELFTKAVVNIYGKNREVEYYCNNYYWTEAHILLRFVLVCMPFAKGLRTSKFILCCSDLNRSPIAIIHLYSLRFQIELTFKALKSRIGAFCEHFWVACLDKFNYFAKPDEPARDPASLVTDPEDRVTILRTLQAKEMIVQIGIIAEGIIQYLSCIEPLDGEIMKNYWQRTKSKLCVSEAAIQNYLRVHIFEFIIDNPMSLISCALRVQKSVWKERLLKMIDIPQFSITASPLYVLWNETHEKNRVKASKARANRSVLDRSATSTTTSNVGITDAVN